MSWTKAAPTEAGWYWNRKGSYIRGGPLVPIQLYDDDDSDNPELGSYSERHNEFVLAEDLGGEWWPTQIEEPTEGKP